MSSKTLLGLLFGVALFSFSAHAEYEWSTPATRDVVTVKVIFDTPEKIHELCSAGRAYPPSVRILGCYFPGSYTIYAPTPKDFNDHLALEVLGHEIFHALGAQHP